MLDFSRFYKNFIRTIYSYIRNVPFFFYYAAHFRERTVPAEYASIALLNFSPF